MSTFTSVASQHATQQSTAGPPTRKTVAADSDSPELVIRKVRSLLNKLTMTNFDSISDQIIAWTNRSEKEKDGKTLAQVIKLIFERAIDRAAWSEMHARLCRKMMERISPGIQDDDIKTNEGNPIAGGQLFRKYLLNRCQEDFERGWAAKDAAASAAAAKASEDGAAKKAAETSGEAELYSDVYHTVQKAKRQGLGLIQFIGELYKLQMLTERIMHECIKKLLGNVDNPEEEEIESLCRLLTTVGQLLDNVKARQHMDIYFSRMKELIKSINVSSRMRHMLQDLIELRERKWISRNQVAAPTTITAVHEAAAKERLAREKESSNRALTFSRRRGGDRGDHAQGGDGRSVVGGSSPSRPPPNAGDLSQFSKITKASPMTFGPSSVFTKKDPGKRESTLSRADSNSNVFSMLSGGGDPAAVAKSSRPSSRRTSVDLGQSRGPEPPARRRELQLLSQMKPVEETKANCTSDDQSDDESEVAESAEPMSKDEANKRITKDIKAFFSIRSIDKSEDYFGKLPTEHLFRLVDRMATMAIESKEADARLVADTFQRAVEKNLCSSASFEEGFIPTAEILEDIAIDAPNAFNLMAIVIKGAGLDKDEERLSRIVDKLSDRDQLLPLLA